MTWYRDRRLTAALAGAGPNKYGVWQADTGAVHRHVAGYDKQPLMDKVLSFLERCAAEETDFKKHAAE